VLTLGVKRDPFKFMVGFSFNNAEHKLIGSSHLTDAETSLHQVSFLLFIDVCFVVNRVISADGAGSTSGTL